MTLKVYSNNESQLIKFKNVSKELLKVLKSLGQLKAKQPSLVNANY